MQLLVLVGSLRKDSFNRHLVETMRVRYENLFSIEEADIRNIPFYDEDQADLLPESVVRMKQQVKVADGVIIVTPEYNRSFPAVIKNALEWLSRGDRELMGKPVLLAGSSPFEMQTSRAHQHLRDALSSPGLAPRMLPPGSDDILIAIANEKFTNDLLTDKVELDFLDKTIEKFIHLVQSPT